VLPESILTWQDGYRAPSGAALPREDHEQQEENSAPVRQQNARHVHQTVAFSEDSDLDLEWMPMGEVGT
jgi:hypothetical protein